jgi:hypothetical protein
MSRTEAAAASGNMRLSHDNASSTNLNMSLNDWISEQEIAATSEFNKASFQQQLQKRGYEKDLNTSIRELMFFSPRLLLNSLYECLIQSGTPENKAGDILKRLANQATAIENESNAIAHFIWVGPPTQNGNELLGTKSLSKQKANQPIKLWVLEEHVEAYKERLKNLKNVTIVSIENYAKKINISFDATEEVTLHSQIQKLKGSAEEKMRGKLDADKRRGVRDRVSIVDYLKSVIPLYEGGWIFDADIMFLNSDQELLTKPDKWIFPSISSGNRISRDVWFFYRDKVMDWNINKMGGGAFKAKTIGEPAWQMLLYIYHLIILYVNSTEMSDYEKIDYYASAIVLMDGTTGNLFSCFNSIKEIEKALFGDQEVNHLASTWIAKNNSENFLLGERTKTFFADVCSGRSGDLCFSLDYSLFHVQAKKSKGLVNFNLIKRMNRSYVTGNKTLMQFSYLSIETVPLFKEIIAIMKEFNLCNELWTWVSGDIPNSPGIWYPIEVESLTALHIAAAMRLEFFEVMLDAIPNDLLHKLFFDKVAMPELFFNSVKTLYKPSINLIESIVKTRPMLTEKVLEKLKGIKHQNAIPLNLSSCELKNIKLSGELFKDGDFSDTHLLNIRFTDCKLNGIIISEKTKFKSITLDNNSVCEYFRYRLSDSNNLLKLSSSDFIRQSQLYYEKLSSPTGSNLMFEMLNDDKKTHVEKLFYLFEFAFQQDMKNLVESVSQQEINYLVGRNNEIFSKGEEGIEQALSPPRNMPDQEVIDVFFRH